MKALAESIRGLNQLQNLIIRFSAEISGPYIRFPMITGEATQHLANAISTLTTLNTLQLEFHRCPNVANFTMPYLTRSQLSLTYLDLSFTSTSLEDVALSKFSGNLSRLSKLSMFKLNIQSGSITDDGLSKLIESLTKMEKLSVLELNLQFCDQIANQSAKAIESLLESHPHLTEFKLQCRGTNFTESQIGSIQDIRSKRNFQSFLIEE
eukprot:TRINITY_DN4964_c0_g1_i3.p1 TRINITY_DN4964_c0_g1~~TRINITY_DN4964_c0_g1_i3.p1  ORF type:complete len:209 (+),score=19.50 TRINITY_DN4964_c0_g1_i3:370-996(+)